MSSNLKERLIDLCLLIPLQIYFVLMNVTVERFYCQTPFDNVTDKRFLVQETIAFCKANNPLFLERPRWMQVATCISAYGYAPFYCIIMFAALTNKWHKFRIVILFFIGAKFNALAFYHIMEFTSTTPPQNLLPYFAVEGPYLVSMILVVIRIIQSSKIGGGSSKATIKKKKTK
uniref:EXPERA domain-containing protein n=1 Tax=Aureoumbra lagunensis TaxID=44058 RepID=A0A7S3K6A4_9STRA|mmetsp:Transcript_18248/g.27515  ORF Transcript_18248/g.27515 Transcript_18248/m.27515 type:complete len:174 (-) Transcript_18248:18-539(-)